MFKMFGNLVRWLPVLLGWAAWQQPGQAEPRGKYEIYPSSLDPELKLSAQFFVPDQPKPLCLFFHGWHGAAPGEMGTALVQEYFVVSVDMRGRGKSSGAPDASGLELLDGLDALNYARATWPEAVRPGSGLYVVGGSGGGGNTLALVGKAPDLFTAAATWAAMSDYALWYQDDTGAAYRDEMETKGWIGGTPASNPDGYFSRGGINVIDNVLTSLLVIHGTNDGCVRVQHAERYEQAAKKLGKQNVSVVYNGAGHGSEEWPRMMEFLRSAPPPPALPAKGRLRLCSFLACRAFWLVPDSPDCIADVTYAMDSKGNLESLSFTQEKGRLPVKTMRLRVFGPPARVKVRLGAESLRPAAVVETGSYRDYRWDVKGDWIATVER